ncbi:DUF2478 domain-containing protein [Entomomonas asaccharolytica]|uniref:DUF2478 domain-containing protein n=1 Tax=Entomomonas asaccharolytica TaxID=2785331 RepID=A0A974ND92_9GAMM|nr:DUF2478 domain-containing protein [Entomomonas asaccharolytica]QQP84287.1 DUF2478 domain-containing protein [Entomomonas asaccharolytica]
MKNSNVDIATIMHRGDGEYDWLIREFVNELTTAGWNVQGLLTKRSRNPMIIYNLNDNQEFIISQQLGKQSLSCSLDLGELAAAAFVLRKALAEKADLVIVNRFGTAEAEGKGFIAEMLALMNEGIPILTLTNIKYLTQWNEFTGGLAVELKPNKQALHDWFKRIKNIL